MDNEEFIGLIQQGSTAAHLLGQIHGKIHGLIEKSCTESVRQDLVHLFDYITQEVGNIYYKKEVKNEKIET